MFLDTTHQAMTPTTKDVSWPYSKHLHIGNHWIVHAWNVETFLQRNTYCTYTYSLFSIFNIIFWTVAIQKFYEWNILASDFSYFHIFLSRLRAFEWYLQLIWRLHHLPIPAKDDCVIIHWPIATPFLITSTNVTCFRLFFARSRVQILILLWY